MHVEVAEKPEMNPSEEHFRDEGLRIGGRLRDLRKSRNVTLQMLAEGVGVSAGYLSQIERGLSQLPVALLVAISKVLDVRVSDFLDPQENVATIEDLIVRAKSRRRLVYTGTGIHEEMLSPSSEMKLTYMISNLEPGSDSGSYSHEGEECGLVLEGRLDLWVGEKKYVLEAGDSFAFKSKELHRSANSSSKLTRVAWATTSNY